MHAAELESVQFHSVCRNISHYCQNIQWIRTDQISGTESFSEWSFNKHFQRNPSIIKRTPWLQEIKNTPTIWHALIQGCFHCRHHMSEWTSEAGDAAADAQAEAVAPSERFTSTLVCAQCKMSSTLTAWRRLVSLSSLGAKLHAGCSNSETKLKQV